MDPEDILLSEQATDMYDIGRVLPNLKKLGKARITLATVEQRIGRVKELWTAIKKRHSLITIAIAAEGREGCSYFANNHLEACLATVDETLDDLNMRVSMLPNTTSAVTTITEQAAPSRPVVPLPIIDMPKFDGSTKQWEPFRDRFTALIIADTRLTHYERMHYLMSAVSGEAREAIRHITVSEANFANAWEELRERFEHERDLITGHVRDLLTLQKLKPKSVQCIRQLRASVTATLHALRNLNRPVDEWDDLLVQIVVLKLDDASNSDWEFTLRSSKRYPKFAELIKFLDERARMLTAVVPRQGQREDESVATKQNKSPKYSSLAIT